MSPPDRLPGRRAAARPADGGGAAASTARADPGCRTGQRARIGRGALGLAPTARPPTSTDIKLDRAGGTWILAEAAVLKTTAADVMVDSPARPPAAAPVARSAARFRRALVHGTGDALVLNYAASYIGGVVVHGPLTAGGAVVASGE